jgi:exosome complex component RRP42
VDLRGLCILAGKTCWVLYVDALVLNDGGNVLGALALAARAALAATRVARVEVVMGEAGEEPEVEIDDEGDGVAPLEAGRLPALVTVSQVGPRVVLDLTSEEEACAAGALHVAVGPKGQLCGVSKAGGAGVHPGVVAEMLEAAQRAAPRLLAAMDAHLRAAGAVGG